MHVLLLGSTGFLGRHLAAELLARGDDVEGWSRARAAVDPRVVHRSVDLLERESLESLAGTWDAVVLLAGHTVPGVGFDAAQSSENVRMAESALAFVASHSSLARIVVLSSAHVYAPMHASGGAARAIDETHAVAPVGEYGRSKLRVEDVARESAAARDLDVVIARSFNQIGPGQPRGLFVPDLLSRFASGAGPIQMRGGDGERDFLDVRDGARALADLLAPSGTSRETFNVCSGRAVKLSAIAHGLADRLGIEREIVFEPGPSTRVVGSHAKLTRATGWEPRVALEDTLDWIAAAARAV